MQTTTSRKAKKSTTRDHYQEITDKVIAALITGVIPWQTPNSTDGGLAYNYVSGKEYRGINFFLLNFMRPHANGAYLTFNQARKLGGKVRKGARSQKVYFFKVMYRDTNGKPLTDVKARELMDRGVKVKGTPFMKTSPVFNVEDVEGIEFDLPQAQTFEHNPVKAADDFVAGILQGPQIRTSATRGNFYRPLTDEIVMYPRNRYKTVEAYYQTLFHELTHATGHGDRLNREGITGEIKAGSAKYAREELTAEMGAAFLCSKMGIEPDIDNTAAYIANWLQALKNDKLLVYKAAAQAQQAVDYLTGGPHR